MKERLRSAGNLHSNCTLPKLGHGESCYTIQPSQKNSTIVFIQNHVLLILFLPSVVLRGTPNHAWTVIIHIPDVG